jgi:hypothetical protein
MARLGGVGRYRIDDARRSCDSCLSDLVWLPMSALQRSDRVDQLGSDWVEQHRTAGLAADAIDMALPDVRIGIQAEELGRLDSTMETPPAMNFRRFDHSPN